MKKKIKDLTFEESKKICEKEEMCCDCPLSYTAKCFQTLRDNEFLLEREVEI